MRMFLKLSPLLFLVMMAGIFLWHRFGGMNDLAFNIVEILLIVLATAVGVYRWSKDRHKQ